MQSQNEENKLENIRYDSKLFNQVYRASIKAKSLEKEEIRKRRILKTVGFFFLFVCIVLVIIFNPFKRIKYNDVTPQDRNGNSWYQIILPEVNTKRSIEVKIPKIKAKSILIYQIDTNSILYEKNVNDRLPIASLTKLLTSIISLENLSPEEMYKLEGELPKELGWGLGLAKGDIVTRDNLLKAALISSFNDSAFALASVYGQQEFLDLMNQRVDILGLQNTHFSNSTGLDNKDNYSSAKDLLSIVKLYLNYPTLTDLSKKLSSVVEWVDKEGNIQKQTIYTTNTLLVEYPGVKGLKTGNTDNAQQCLITYYSNKKGEFIIILLGSNDRFDETRKILNSLN